MNFPPILLLLSINLYEKSIKMNCNKNIGMVVLCLQKATNNISFIFYVVEYKIMSFSKNK